MFRFCNNMFIPSCRDNVKDHTCAALAAPALPWRPFRPPSGLPRSREAPAAAGSWSPASPQCPARASSHSKAPVLLVPLPKKNGSFRQAKWSEMFGRQNGFWSRFGTRKTGGTRGPRPAPFRCWQDLPELSAQGQALGRTTAPQRATVGKDGFQSLGSQVIASSTLMPFFLYNMLNHMLKIWKKLLVTWAIWFEETLRFHQNVYNSFRESDFVELIRIQT